MVARMLAVIAVVIVALGLTGCGAMTSGKWGYVGPPLYAFQDGYVEDQTLRGPAEMALGENTGPPSVTAKRYAWINPRTEQEWFVFQGPQGQQGVAGPIGAHGPQGPQGIAGIAGPQGPQGSVGVAGLSGKPGVMFAIAPDGTKSTVAVAGTKGAASPSASVK